MIDRTCGSKPMSNMRSASSNTRSRRREGKEGKQGQVGETGKREPVAVRRCKQAELNALPLQQGGGDSRLPKNDMSQHSALPANKEALQLLGLLLAASSSRSSATQPDARNDVTAYTSLSNSKLPHQVGSSLHGAGLHANQVNHPPRGAHRHLTPSLQVLELLMLLQTAKGCRHAKPVRFAEAACAG